MALIEVIIPTYKRSNELAKCLFSLEKSIKNTSLRHRSKVGISVRNNTTENFIHYRNLIEKYSTIFKKLGVAFFNYHITGFNIGGINNILGGFFSSKSEYVWFLPDDDIVRFDAFSIIIFAIEKYNPCFLSGGCLQKSRIKKYDSNEDGKDDGESNSILEVLYDNTKISTFLLNKGPVQAQEYIYSTKCLNKFLDDDSNLDLINEMHPGMFAIFCLKSPFPFVRLKRSIGIFRDGDPNSEWRHLWWKFALIDWPILSKKLWLKGWLNKKEMIISTRAFISSLSTLSGRPDILLGLNWKSKINPFVLLKNYPYDYLVSLIKSPINCLKAIKNKLKIMREANNVNKKKNSYFQDTRNLITLFRKNFF